MAQLTRETSVAIITMVRKAEFPAAWSSLRTVESQLNSTTRHFLLLNDARDSHLESQLAARRHTELITPGANLGVAAGRNRLIAAALDWGAATIISLDDDLLVPSDYIDRITEWLAARAAEGSRVGVVAPVVLDFHALADKSMTPEAISRAEAGQIDESFDTAELRDQVRTAWKDDIPPSAVYHAGIRDWQRHYLGRYRGKANALHRLYTNSRGNRNPEEKATELRLDRATRRAILDEGGALAVDALPGGACTYTSELLQAIGGIDEAFSPFGFEDSDFAIRAKAAGFSNYILPSEIVLHDLDARAKQRPPAIINYGQGRARALIARKHLPPRHRMRVIAENTALAPMQAFELSRSVAGRKTWIAAEIVASTVPYLAGLVEGLMTEPSEPDFGGFSQIREYPEFPERMERQKTFTLRSWENSPADGLPAAFPVDMGISYSWDAERGLFRLARLTLDSPGQFRIALKAELHGIGQRDSSGNPDLEACALHHAEIQIEDWGFLRRFETTVAWFRRERTTGYLARLLAKPASEAAHAFWWFLSLRDVPARLDITVSPQTPIHMTEFDAETTSVNLQRRLGLSAIVNQTVRY